MAAQNLNAEINAAIKKLQDMTNELSIRERKAILRKAAKPVLEAAKSNITDSKKPHYRYATAKASKGIRAPKGSGKVVATYYPGNLKDSLSILSFRRAQSSVFVGPKLAKRGAKGTFGAGEKVDGYYAAMVETGTVNFPGQYYMRRAYNSEKETAIKEVEKAVAKKIKAFARKNKV